MKRKVIILIELEEDENVEKIGIRAFPLNYYFNKNFEVIEIPSKEELDEISKKEYSRWAPNAANHELEFFKFGVHWILRKLKIW